MSDHPLVLAITGASGAPYAVRLLQVLAAAERPIHLTISPSGAAVLKQELGVEIPLRGFDPQALLQHRFAWETDRAGDSLSAAGITYHHYQDYMTPIASGSFLTAGMIICPCSGSTLSAVARSAGSNLVQRAAEVHLKEQRKLVIVPRETPLSVFQLENMHRLAAAGVVVLPAMPGWYHDVRGLGDLVDFVVGRIIDQFGIENRLISRWKEGS